MSQTPYQLNRSTYDRIAPQFAQVYASMTPDLIDAAQRLCSRLGPRPARLLDLGCGAGRDLAWFYAQAQTQQGLACFGADLSTGMLSEARQVTGAPLCQADMRFLGFAPRSFAGIWCVAALLHLPKAEAPRALAEMARVLVPGGGLYISVQKGSGEGNEPTPYDASLDRFYARYELDEISTLLAQAGFSILAQGENFRGRHWLWFDAALAA